ncbi:MAG TPA: bifunctional methylenetetrahydrofolate dehydrogenase/methenyltetrahydrofolate cyclohydrolase FolD [Clostridia bacterium]|nr:bifunctional methylenetetrahydrofolate dehydrogenase/methenyltetrahydrofolate cyclohydrolase FolD [Clostridia bacterium]
MELIDGKLVAKLTRQQIKEEVDKLIAEGGEIGLAVVLVGENPASMVYVNNKIKACKEVGINSYLHKLDSNVTAKELTKLLAQLNADNKVNGIIVQLPLPKGLDEREILNSIDPSKDVDGCHYVQKGKLWTGNPELIACTPFGVIKMLEHYDIPIRGQHAVIVGRSNLVGKPLAELLLDKDATVTICHSKTRNMKEITLNADILCVAVGKPKFITKDMVKEGAVVIDIGINRVDSKLIGDTDYENIADKCSYITPVPGGVGPMTVTMLLANTVTAYKLKK